GGIGDLVDGRDDVEHRRHLLGVTTAAGGDEAQDTHVEHESIEPVFEASQLFGDVDGVVVEGGVRQVDHQLRGVLRLGEHLLEVLGGLVHQSGSPHYARPRISSAPMTAKAPMRSMDDVTIGIPWLSGSRPRRTDATAMPYATRHAPVVAMAPPMSAMPSM